MSTTTTDTRTVRASIPGHVHRALRLRQNTIEESSGTRPQMTDVVTTALTEWANEQSKRA